jgi:hypothetical protein
MKLVFLTLALFLGVNMMFMLPITRFVLFLIDRDGDLERWRDGDGEIERQRDREKKEKERMRE